VNVTFIRTFLIRVRGGEPLPDGVTFPLERGERVLTWGRVAGGGIAAATDSGLRVRLGDGSDPTLIRWHEISKATWADGHLVVEDMARTPTSYKLTEPRGVPPAVREHVNATVIVSQHHEIDGHGIRVVARRDLRDGKLHWSAVFDAPTQPTESQRHDADELIAAVRRRFGDQLR
jgi:hypothetical protein